MSEFPQIDKMEAQAAQGAGPSGIPAAILLLIVVGILIFAILILGIWVFTRALSQI